MYVIDLYKGPQESRLSSLWGAFPPASAVGREITLAKNKKEEDASSQIFYL